MAKSRAVGRTLILLSLSLIFLSVAGGLKAFALVDSKASPATTLTPAKESSDAAAVSEDDDVEPEVLSKAAEEEADTEADTAQTAKDKDDDDDEPEVVVVSPFTEEQRLKGFVFHRKYNQQFELYRLSGVGSVKKSREEWEKMMASTVPEYKRKRALEAAPLDESSAAYKKDLQKKYDFDLKLDAARRRYIKARDLAHQKRQSVKLSEEEEYGLFSRRERARISERSLYSGKSKSKGSSGSSSGGSSGSYDSGGGGSSGGYEAPPPPPSIPSPPVPDFYEPDIPPPPPMPMDGGSFDEGIPPPIFDEPEF